MSTEEIISAAQLLANRLNAEKSTGPKTEEGKRISKMNALRHGLTGCLTIMPWEDRVAYEAFLTEQESQWNAETPMEKELAVSIAEDLWRLKRARALDENIYAIAHPGMTGEPEPSFPADVITAAYQARAFIKDAKQLQLLTLYGNRIHRTMERNVARLEELQAKRIAERIQAFEEAQLLARLAEMEGQRCDPEGNAPAIRGFVFSYAEINAANLHAERLRVAKFYERHHWDPKMKYPHPRMEPISLPLAA